MRLLISEPGVGAGAGVERDEIAIAVTRDEIYALRAAIVEAFEALHRRDFEAHIGETQEWLDGLLLQLKHISQTTYTPDELAHHEAVRSGRESTAAIKPRGQERIAMRRVDLDSRSVGVTEIADDEMVVEASVAELRGLERAMAAMLRYMDDDWEFDIRVGYPRTYTVDLHRRLRAIVERADTARS